MHWKTFGSTPGLYPLQANSTRQPTYSKYPNQKPLECWSGGPCTRGEGRRLHALGLLAAPLLTAVQFRKATACFPRVRPGPGAEGHLSRPRTAPRGVTTRHAPADTGEASDKQGPDWTWGRTLTSPCPQTLDSQLSRYRALHHTVKHTLGSWSE